MQQLLPYVDFFKIASYELLWSDLITACARTGKPLVLSTGMATLPEVQAAVAIARNAGCKELTLLHCISGYPTPPEDCNLAAIETLRSACNCTVGWSDHSVNPGILYRAIYRWDAELIEFHIDLDGEGDEYVSGHCWLPEQIQSIIQTLKSGISADGSGEKRPVPSELPDRDWRADPDDGLRPLRHIRKAWKP